MNLQEAFEAVLKHFEGDLGKTLVWFSCRNIYLGGIRPATMIHKGREEKLIKYIENALEGIYP